MKHVSQILIIILLAGLLAACGHKTKTAPEDSNTIDAGDYVIYTGPPARTIDLDSVDDLSGQIYYKRPPDNLKVEFNVVDADSCHVSIDLHLTPKDVVRHVVDGTFAHGAHEITWNTLDKHKARLPENVYYYQFDICGKISTKRLNYRMGDFGTMK